MKRYFVTGTGTGVGKTFVTCAIARLAREHGLRVVAHKPIETGCPLDRRNPRTGRLGEDQWQLVEASSVWVHDREPEVKFGPYQLELPLAPSVASAHEHVEIDFDLIAQVMDRASRGPLGPVDVFLVEGAGGWRVPITESKGMADLARLVDGEVVVVGTAGLGTINHSLLSLEAIERDGFRVAALVLSNRPEDTNETVQRNVVEIGKRWKGRICLISDLEPLLPLHVERSQTRETP